MSANRHDPERAIDLDLIRCTENAALAARAWLGKGDKNNADLEKVWNVEDMARGEHIIFAATGISDSPMLRGIRHEGPYCITESILMRARNRTVRRIQAYHDIRRKTIRLASTGREVPL